MSIYQCNVRMSCVCVCVSVCKGVCVRVCVCGLSVYLLGFAFILHLECCWQEKKDSVKTLGLGGDFSACVWRFRCVCLSVVCTVCVCCAVCVCVCVCVCV